MNNDGAIGGTGAYLFCNLPQGQYVVKLTAPASYVSSKDPATGGAPDNNTHSDDNGAGTTLMAVSAPITLQPGSLGAAFLFPRCSQNERKNKERCAPGNARIPACYKRSGAAFLFPSFALRVI